MDCAKTGRLIRRLRREAGMTQRQLADRLNISFKTVSKWELGAGCPDVSLLVELAAVLSVRVEDILSGETPPAIKGKGSFKTMRYFVCPACGQLTATSGNAGVFCCGAALNPLESKKAADDEKLNVELSDDAWYVTSAHPMEKAHYIAYVIFERGESAQIIRAYPEWDLGVRLPRAGHGKLMYICTRDGLFYQTL